MPRRNAIDKPIGRALPVHAASRSQVEALANAAKACKEVGDWRGVLMFAELAWARARQANDRKLATTFGEFIHACERDVILGNYNDAQVRNFRLSASTREPVRAAIKRDPRSRGKLQHAAVARARTRGS